MSRTPTALGRHARSRSAARRAAAAVAGVLAAVLVLAVAAGATAYVQLNGNITSIDVSGALGTDRPTSQASASPAPDSPLNILLMGTDDRAQLSDGDEYGGDIGLGGSDVTILVHLYQGRQRAVAVSIPRDSVVPMPSCGERLYGSEGMFNSALAEGGPACAIKTLEQNTGVAVDHFAIINFDGVKSMVDALGGVDVCLPEAVDDPKSGLDLPAGTSHVSGEQGLAFVRARYGFSATDGSDIGRIGRQQQFLSSVVQEATSSRLLLRPDRLLRFLDAATSSLTTDPGLAGIKELTTLAQSVSGLTPADVDFVTVPFEAYEPDPNRLQWAPEADALWQAIIHDEAVPGTDPLPGATPTATPTPTEPALTVSPADISVQVLNATGEAGRAGQAAADLQVQGFTVAGTGDAEIGSVSGAVVRYPTGQEAAAATVAAAFPDATTRADPTLSGPVVVTLGEGAPDVVEVPNRLPGAALPQRSTPSPTPSIDSRSGAEDICS